ncbi:homoserine kinase type II [Acinetobacter calcoaceticus]|uniref:Homoserine kinase n=1 Tax=Acinetobacter calcoaceticus TaxID=471 RepID=A0A4R1Y331_ACICA|nr:homoserine kinase type II [Acinetobacter calcoaceticus]
MSVYTTLSLAQVQAFAAPYGLEVSDLIPIQGGIQNTNYFLQSPDQTQHVLTVFEDMTAAQAAEIVPVLDHLAAQGLAVAVPLKYDGQAIHMIVDKPAQIAPRLYGSHPEQPDGRQVAAIAKAQATLHVALKDFALQREFNRNHDYWKQVATDFMAEMDAADRALLQQLLAVFALKKQQHPDRPQGLIHADLFRDNTLFQDQVLTGILDFYELHQDEFLYDIAISMNDFCTDYPEYSLNTAKREQFLAAYQSVRGLTSDELACLDTYLAVVACRFWLMRLDVAKKNQMQGRVGDDILLKNPLEMRGLLQERLKSVQQ